MRPTILIIVLLILLGAYSNRILAQNLSQFSYKELDSLVLIPESEGDYATCLLYMETGRKKAEAEFGTMDTTYARYTADLGFFYYYLGQYAQAEPLFLEAEKIRHKVWGELHSEYAMNIDNLASIYQDIGDYEKAELYALKSTEIRAKLFGETHLDYARSLNNLASFYQIMGNYEKAEPLFLQSLNIRKKQLGEESDSYATAANNLASLYHDKKQYDDAEALYITALNIRAKIDGKDHPDYAQYLNNLGNLYYTMGQNKKAEVLFVQAKNIWSKTYGEEHPSFVTTLSNLAMVYQALENYTLAEKYYLQAKDLDLKNFGEKHPYVALSYNNLTSLYLEMGKLEEALVACSQSIVANSMELDKDFNTWSKLDDYTFFSNVGVNKSIAMLLDIFEKNYKKTKDQTYLKQHHEIAQAAIRINERTRNDFSGEQDKLRNLATNHQFVIGAIRSAVALQQPNYVQAAFRFAELNKAVLLLDAEKTEQAYKFGDLPDSLARKERTLQKQQSDLKALIMNNLYSDEKESLQAELGRLNHEIDLFSKKIEADYPKYAVIKYGNKTTEPKDIQVLLDNKTALIEYVIADSMVYIFYVDQQTIQLEQVVISNVILNQKIKDFHDVLSNYKLLVSESSVSYRRYTSNAHWFYTNLVAPVLKYAKGISNLIIVADGELGHLPFESFLVELASQKETNYQELHYLVQDYAISYNYSAALWKEYKTSKKHTNNGQLFAMAANYELKNNSTPNKGTEAYRALRKSLMPLPVAREEVALLDAAFDGFFAFDEFSNEKTFKEKAGNYAIIHLAMHGLLNPEAPILSSIVFTDTKDSLENNFLQAYEISKLQLNADLVILSACETGYGKFEKGNGIASLAQAFAYAGAPSMIVSLWQVNDHATSEIMKRLYQNLAQGINKDIALQQAKIEYLKLAEGISAHPAFWSPFILMGNDAPVYIKTKSNWMWWLVGGMVLLLGIVYGLKYRNV